MGKLIKILLIFFASLLALILAAVIIIPLVIDLNDYKPEIETAIKDKTGRTLSIEGPLDVSVFPWLGISTGKISLSNAPSFTKKHFATLDGSNIKVKLIPLFSKKVEVDTIILKGLKLHLEKNKQGISNWDDLTAPKQVSSQPTEPEPEQSDDKITLETLAINGLKIENAQISWDDQQSGQHIRVKGFNLTSDVIAFNQPISLKASLLIENTDPAITEKIAFSTRLNIDQSLQKIQLLGLTLDSTTKGQSVPGETLKVQLTSDLFLDLQAQTLALKKLVLDSRLIHLTADINASELNTNPQYNGTLKIAPFNPKELLQQLQMEVPETADQEVLQSFSMDLSIKGTDHSIVIDKLNIALDDTKILGHIKIKNFKQPETTFKLAIDNIDIDRYSPPKKVEIASKNPVASTVATVTPLIPVETIRALNLSGDLNIDHLKIAQLTLSGVSLKLDAKQGLVKTEHHIKRLYNGSYLGQITLNAKSKTPTFTFNEKISGVQIELLLKDLSPNKPARLKGTTDLTAHLNSRGNSIPTIKSALDGQINFALHKSAINGFNLQQIIDIGRLVFKAKKMQQNYTNEQTVFSVIKGTATIKKGIINNPDFLATSSDTDIKGAGTINLVNDALAYKITAKLKKNYNKGKLKLDGRSIEIDVSGTTQAPTYQMNALALLSTKEKKKVDKLVNKGEKAIDKVLGKGTGKAVNQLLNGLFK